MFLKICGLCRTGDAAFAAEAGATHAGVIRVPGTPRHRSVSEARAVLDAGAGLRRVGVFADADVDEIVRETEALGLDVVQLHGQEPTGTILDLQDAGFEVWKVIKPADGAALVEAASSYEAADLLLIEGASAAGLGGVGALFDWDAVAPALERLPPTTLYGIAGGLTPDNVAEAVARLRPMLMDVSSGVESAPGEKDAEKMRAFVARALGRTGGVEAG